MKSCRTVLEAYSCCIGLLKVIPCMQQVLRRCIYQNDNTRAHMAKLITNIIGNNNINVLDLPSVSPDLAPIENIWWSS